MLLGRRTLLAAAIPAITRPAFAAPSPVVRIGTLRFGTVSWEADVIRHHGLDAAAAITVEIITFATPQAAQVALQSGAVDMVVADWLFVARQRASGADWSFIPFSNAVGALIAPAGSPVRAVPDLVGRTLGVAGTPLDKSWLILRAYAMKRYGIDLRTATKPSFGPPPLLNEQMNLGRLDALLTFWPQAAKAEAAGARRVLAVEDAVAGLGVSTGVPYIGYIFSQAWAEKTPQAISGFITAVQQARTRLATSDAEWQRLKPNTGAVDDAELTRLRDWYRLGIPNHWAQPERAAAAELFALLAQIGGPELVGPLTAIPAGTFWPVTW
jgi:NitT/TauT family transport system substrate-binding protein